MAKTDSFFIRASVAFSGTNFVQEAIDLGAYVDALGKSVLRIHNISVQYGSGLQTPSHTGSEAACGYQVTTQSQGQLRAIDDKSLIASGQLTFDESGGNLSLMNDSTDLNPQAWKNGYLVGVEQIYLGADQNAVSGFTRVSIVMECTVETLSQSAAMALALSQQ